MTHSPESKLDLEALGAGVRAFQDPQLDASPLPQMPSAAPAAAAQRQPQAWLRWVAPLAVGACAVLLWRANPKDVGEPPPAVAVAPSPQLDWTATVAARTWSLPHAVISADPGTRLQALRRDPKGATVRLHGGHATFAVEPATDRDWRVLAGPYEVRVVGTRFEVTWDAATEGLDITLHEGRVELRDGERAEMLEPGDHVRRGPAAEVPTVVPVEDAPAEGPTAERGGQAPSATDNPSAPPAAVRKTSTLGRARGPGPRWQALARRGEHAEALDAARAEGIEGILARGKAADLVRLADVARFGREPKLARQALERVRARFSGSSSAHAAAYELGRLAERAGQDTRAIEWWTRYLNEAPKGAHRRDALTRRMQLRAQRGETSAARADAKLYLKRYPQGPAAAFAERLLAVP